MSESGGGITRRELLLGALGLGLGAAAIGGLSEIVGPLAPIPESDTIWFQNNITPVLLKKNLPGVMLELDPALAKEYWKGRFLPIVVRSLSSEDPNDPQFSTNFITEHFGDLVDFVEWDFQMSTEYFLWYIDQLVEMGLIEQYSNRIPLPILANGDGSFSYTVQDMLNALLTDSQDPNQLLEGKTNVLFKVGITDFVVLFENGQYTYSNGFEEKSLILTSHSF